MSGGRDLLPKFMPISFFTHVARFGVFQDTWRSKEENPSAHWKATLSCPLLASNYANLHSFRSRSGCWPFLGLQSCGPGKDPFRASGPKWGRKWPKNGFWPHLGNGANRAWKMGKMARNSVFEPFLGDFLHFSGHSSHFPGQFFWKCKNWPGHKTPTPKRRKLLAKRPFL